MKENRKVLYNFLIIGLSNSTNLLLPILLIPAFVNRLGLELYGVVALSQSVMSYMNIIVEYHFSTITVKEIAINRENHEALNIIVCRTIWMRLCFLVICLFLVILIAILYPPFSAHYNIIEYSFMLVIGQAILPNWFLIGMEEVAVIAILNIAFKIIYVTTALTLIKNSGDAHLPNFLLGLSNFIAGIVGLSYAFWKYNFNFRFSKISEITSEVRAGYLMTVSNISSSVYNSGAPMILALFCSPKIVGSYTAAERILGVFRNVLAVYFQATYPRAAKIMPQGKHFLNKFYRDTFPFILTGIAFCSFVFFIDSEQIMRLVFRISSPLISDYVRLLMGVILINCLNIPFYQRLLLFDAKKANLVIIPGCALAIILNFSLIPYFGPIGCIISIAVTELFIILALYYQNVKYNLI